MYLMLTDKTDKVSALMKFIIYLCTQHGHLCTKEHIIQSPTLLSESRKNSEKQCVRVDLK